jgi:hypothetical protein
MAASSAAAAPTLAPITQQDIQTEVPPRAATQTTSVQHAAHARKKMSARAASNATGHKPARIPQRLAQRAAAHPCPQPHPVRLRMRSPRANLPAAGQGTALAMRARARARACAGWWWGCGGTYRSSDHSKELSLRERWSERKDAGAALSALLNNQQRCSASCSTAHAEKQSYTLA